MPSIFLHLPDPSQPFAYYRALLPIRYLEKQLLGEGIRLVSGPLLTDYRHDAYVIHREVTSPEVFAYLLDRKLYGAKVIWSIDDDFLSVPESNPAAGSYAGHQERVRINAMMEAANFIWCSTPHLATKVPGLKARTVPNLVDMDGWEAVRPVSPSPHHVLWWGGTNTHHEDLMVVREPLRRLMETHGDKVSLRFFGYCPAEFMAAYYPHRLRFSKWVDLSTYVGTLYHDRPQTFLCPLADNEFNRSKSRIRVYDGIKAAAAVVASPVGEYANDSLAWTAPDSETWLHHLRSLVDDESLRVAMADTQRAALMSGPHTWQSEAAREIWLNAFREAVS